jgi:RHS repeat-associated protein
MRQDGELTYLHTDHLGSASLATDATGGVTSEMRYYPYGQTRSGTMDTDRQYTGQRWEAGIGLYDYNARYYDPALGRFVQADTIVPSMAHSQDFNRYSYVRNNPLKYTDPSGHAPPLLLIGVFLAGVALIVNGSTPLPAEQVPPPEQGFIGWSMILLPVAAWYAPTAAEGTGALLCADGDCINEIKTVGDVLCADGDCTNETEQIVDPLQQTLRTATSSPGQRTIHATTRKLQHEFKHASNFGLSGNWSKVMEQKFLDTLQAHVNGTNTVAIEGTYRGTQDVIHYYDPTTGLNVILDLHDNLVAAWQLSKKQIEYLFSNGNVQ